MLKTNDMKYLVRRQPVQSKQRFTVWLDSDLAAWIDSKAAEEHRSRNQQIIYLLEKARKQNQGGE